MAPEIVQGANVPVAEPAQNGPAMPKSTPPQAAEPPVQNGNTAPNSPNQPSTGANDHAATPTGMKNTTPVAPPSRPPPILCLGMAKTGSAFLCAALRHLGLEKVHHGLETSIGEEFRDEWRVLDRAVDATFPNLPSYCGTPFSRDEWDEVFGKYDAVTDMPRSMGLRGLAGGSCHRAGIRSVSHKGWTALALAKHHRHEPLCGGAARAWI